MIAQLATVVADATTILSIAVVVFVVVGIGSAGIPFQNPLLHKHQLVARRDAGRLRVGANQPTLCQLRPCQALCLPQAKSVSIETV